MSLAALTAALAAGCGSDGDQVAGVDRGGNPVAVVTKGEITGFGSVIVNGVRWETGAAEIATDQRTLFRDASSQRLRPFRIDDISPGDALSVAGRETAQGIDARRVTREDAADGVVLRALARDVAAPDFVLLGVTVTTDGATVFESEDGMIDAAAFFTQADGRPVEAEARPAGAVLVASRVRLLE